MFREWLFIDPRLDPGRTKKMEQTLSQRFGKVAKRFGSAMKNAIKGTVFGIGLAFLSKLLNPIEELEDKIKELLGKGSDIRDLAEKYNTTPAKLKQLEVIGQALGVTQDQLEEMMSSYAENIKKAREELAPTNKEGKLSDSTIALRNFVDEQDLAEGFLGFLKSLKSTTNAATRNAFTNLETQERFKGSNLSEEQIRELVKSGDLVQQSGKQQRNLLEQAVFGGSQTGSSRRLIDADFEELSKKLKIPDLSKLETTLEKLAVSSDQQRLIEARNELKSFMDQSQQVTPSRVEAMEARAQKERDDVTRRLKSYEDLSRAAGFLEKITDLITIIQDYAFKGLGMLDDLLKKVSKVTDSGWISRFFK